MRSLVYSAEALSDLREIVRYIDERNPAAAVRMYETFKAEIEKLRAMPGIGHRRDDVKDPRYRCRRVGAYIVVYRFDKDSLTIVRIVHGRQDFKGLFNK